MATRPKLPPHQPRPAAAPTVLEGIRVIDFSRVFAGPFGTQILADMGAEVIKIEHPATGDDIRMFQPPALGGESSFFLSLNRNKKSVALDLSTAEGRRIAFDLIATADIVVENFTTRVMQGYGLDYPSLAEKFPRLIFCSVSAYGRTGALANAPGYDPIAAAESGITYMTLAPGATPAIGGMPFMDTTTAMNAVIGILGALYARDRLGKGQFIDVSLYDTAIHDLGYLGYHFLTSGENPPRYAKYMPAGVPNGVYEASDGSFHVISLHDKHFQKLCADVLGRPELAEDPEYRRIPDRVRNMDKLNRLVGEIFLTNTRDHWVGLLRAAAIPAAPLNSVAEGLSSDLAADRGLLSEIPHPTAGTVPNVRSPIRMSLTPQADPVAPPLLGQHTEAVLRDLLGYEPAKISELAGAGIFGKAVQAGG